MVGGSIDSIAAHLRRVLVAVVGSALLLVACGGEDEPELTFEDGLVELEGRPLNPAEVSDRAEIGETLCQLDDRILDEMWQQLSDEQLAFQDIVIAFLCPERAVLYAGHTGRMVTEEAEQSGVRTSTTRPSSTTADSDEPTTTRPATTPTTTTPTSSGTPSVSSSQSTTSTSRSTSTSTTRPTTSASTTGPTATSTTSSPTSSSTSSSRPSGSTTTTTIGTGTS